jgi:hypothetical protein
MLTANALNAHKMEDLVAMMSDALRVRHARRGSGRQSLSTEDRYIGRGGLSWLERWALDKGQPLTDEPDISPFMRQFDISRGGVDYSQTIQSEN